MQAIAEHTVYDHIDAVPKEFPVKGPIYRRGQQVKFAVTDGDAQEHNGKTGFVNNILYAPNIDHYYQHIRVNTGNYNFIESASRCWELVKECNYCHGTGSENFLGPRNPDCRVCGGTGYLNSQTFTLGQCEGPGIKAWTFRVP